ncbi:hypothetical protein R3P38DRAFT_2785983 [Favolaschia claudopus]|uniref:Pre-mRNA-splicing factor SYF2 n=1 Tax=Favolaschia claudopus TaxID=2862362 RepID=A0AAW0AS92_9AGAR
MLDDEDDELEQIKTKYAANAHRRAAEVYRWRNEDQEREKARKRMAAHRKRLRETDNEWTQYKERCKASDRKYRAKSSVEKHGFTRSNEVYNQRQEARREKKEWIAKALEDSQKQATQAF